MSNDYASKCDSCGKRARTGAVLCASCAEEGILTEAIRYYAHQACTYTEYIEKVRQIEAQAGYRSAP